MTDIHPMGGSQMLSVDICVVGAGPAGIAAATEAAIMGASVLVLDEYAQPGGQYFRRPLRGISMAPDSKLMEEAREGEKRIDAARQAGVRFLSSTLVWGAFADGAVTTYSDRCEAIQPARLILACGAQERPVAFPGWTTPGVITAGAAQALLKGQGVMPGRRILMAGTGPLQIAVAAQLVQAGANVVGVLEASRAGNLFGSGHRFWGQWGRLGEGIQYWRTLRAAKVPLILGRTVARAGGQERLGFVTTTDLDDDWRPISGTESQMEVDTLCLGFGLLPSTKLARLAGCQLTFDPRRGGWVPLLDETMLSSRPGVFVAGEAAGIGGARAAELQGTIAGLSAALQLCKGDPKKAEKRISAARKELESELRFARSLNELFTPKPGILELLTEDTIVCRCEEVTVGQLRGELTPWMAELDAVRTVTRTGMGLCQGGVCESLVAQFLSRETGKPISEVGGYRIRPPLKPVPVGALADLSERLPQVAERVHH